MVLNNDHYTKDFSDFEVLMPTANLMDIYLVNNFYMNLCIGFWKQNKLKPYFQTKHIPFYCVFSPPCL